jgi:hypothetical protein
VLRAQAPLFPLPQYIATVWRAEQRRSVVGVIS